MATVDNELPEKLSHNHPLFLNSIDNSGAKSFGTNLVDLWERCNAIVLSWIMNCVSPELLSGIIYSSNAILWAEFDSLAPALGCACAKSGESVVFMERLKLIKFLMGLNESYEQARSQIIMMIPVPTVNKAYSMLMERESQRAISNPHDSTERSEVTALMSTRTTGGQFRPNNNYNLQCDFCKMKKHTRENYYKIVGYPTDFKSKRRG
ncbi:hypothetical protein A4A49_65368, partial [Nicotiana attenuata]